jgi:hypothetical protein
MEFTCSRCGQVHNTDEISFVVDTPNGWETIPEQNRTLLDGERATATFDGDTHFFMRACLEIPVKGSERVFSYGVWVSLSEKSFQEVSEHWHDSSRTNLGPYFGWLCTGIPEYPDTLFLKAMVHQRPPGARPWIELEPTEHPLAVNQREGIDPKRLQEIITKSLHAEGC